LPGQEIPRFAGKNGPGETLSDPLSLPLEKTRWQKDRRAETAEARIGKTGTTAFLAGLGQLTTGNGLH
jgi:hypothetical protein